MILVGNRRMWPKEGSGITGEECGKRERIECERCGGSWLKVKKFDKFA